MIPGSAGDLVPAALLLAVATLTFPFAFECCAALIVAFHGVREALVRARLAWAVAVAAILAVLALSDDSLRFILHHNVFALFSSESFLASRQAQIIERVALLLSFSCLLLLGRMAARFQWLLPKLELGRFRYTIVIAGGLLFLLIKWNHFVMPLSFFPQKTVSFFGFSVVDPDPTAPVVALMLGAITVVGGSALLALVGTIKIALMPKEGTKDD